MPGPIIGSAGSFATHLFGEVQSKLQSLPAAPALNLAARVAVDAAGVFSPFGRQISVANELRSAFGAVEGKLQHAFIRDEKWVMPSYQTGAGLARALGQICSPKTARAADVWSGCETAMGGELGGTIRSAISLVPLPMPTKVGLFAASYGLDMMVHAHESNPERVRGQMFATGSDFGDMA